MLEYHKTIFFTKVPLGGFYRYKEVFQIYPCDLENMPTSVFQKHYPNILEYTTTEEDFIDRETEFPELKELVTYTATTTTKQDKIFALLSTFTNNLFFQYNAGTGCWGIPMLTDNPGKEANSWSSKWCDNIYYHPDLPRQLKIERFSNPQIRPIKRIGHYQYYVFDPNIDFDRTKEIIFPATIDQLFCAYFALNKVAKTFIDAAFSYTVSALELRTNRPTMSLLASFTAMETMVNLEYRDTSVEKCSECGQLKYRVSKKFKDYLLKYIGGSSYNRRKFNLYYSLRSKIVHTGEQLKTELLFAEIPKEEKDKELITKLEILQIGKLAITNWLLKERN